EPWLRGPIDGVQTHLMPVFHSFVQVREDLATHTAGLATDAIWRKVGPLPALGFQLRHIAGSVDRLGTNLVGGEVSPTQIEFLKSEQNPGASLDELLRGVDAALAGAEEKIRSVPAESLNEPRLVGKKRMPTTVLGLLVHVAEHTQRHLGQAITTAKL